jgi:hypothetical protein
MRRACLAVVGALLLAPRPASAASLVFILEIGIELTPDGSPPGRGG